MIESRLLCCLPMVLSLGCSAFHWVDDATTVAPSTIGKRDSFEVTLYGDLGKDRRTMLLEALEAAHSLLTDPQFDALVLEAGRQPNADGTSGFNPGQCPRIPSENGEGLLTAILDAARVARPHVSAWPNSNAIATTRVGPVNAISIDAERVQMWSGDVADKACLIDTLVHELTHLVLHERSQRYQDSIQTGREFMVSYRLGRLAACAFVRGSGDKTCIEQSLTEPTCKPVRRGGPLETF